MTSSSVRVASAILALVVVLSYGPVRAQHAVRRAIDGRPDATIDLRSDGGVALVQGGWRFSEARLVPTDFKAPGSDLKPSDAPVKTYDYEPHAGAAEFDDSSWARVEPSSLEARRTAELCGASAPTIAGGGLVRLEARRTEELCGARAARRFVYKPPV